MAAVKPAQGDPRHWVGFQLIPGVGAATMLALREAFGTLEEAWLASPSDLRAVGLNERTTEAIAEHRRRLDLNYEMQKIERLGVDVITLEDPRYPRLLREIPYAPALLYVKGTLRPEDELAIAVVGTRRATRYGSDMARRISSDLAAGGVTIVSGLALGIDTIAHRAALDSGARTIAVCGCGLDIVYPARNRKLAAQIAERGALVSEFPVGTKPEARNFPARNRIVSGMSRGVLVVEAPRRSGALITASFAADQGRDVYAVPGSALSPASAGCHALIRDGATLVTSGQDILEEFAIESVRGAVQTRMELPASPQEQALYQLIGAEPRHIDELYRESGLTIQDANSILLAMELKGLIRQQGAGHYVRA